MRDTWTYKADVTKHKTYTLHIFQPFHSVGQSSQPDLSGAQSNERQGRSTAGKRSETLL